MSNSQVSGFRRILTDSGFLIFEKVVNLGLVLVVSIYIIRYLGPTQFGYLEYANSLIAIVLPFGRLGMSHIAIKELVTTNDNEKSKILGTVFYTMLFSGMLGALSITVFGIITETSFEIKLLIAIISTKIIFQAFDIFDYYLQSEVLSRYSVIARITYQVVVSLSKLFFAIFAFSLVYFGLSVFLGCVFQVLVWLIIFKKRFPQYLALKFESSYAKKFLRQSWPLLISGLSLALYMKVDIVMLRQLVSPEEVGNYSVATRLSTLWYFIPMALTTSLFPSIIKTKLIDESKYQKRLSVLYQLMIVLAIVPAIVLSFLGNDVIYLLFGSDYSSAGFILSIHIWSGIFVFVGIVRSKWIVNENLQKFGMTFNILGALLNVLLNMLLIPKYGAIGAAFTTFFSQMFSAYISGIIFKGTRNSFFVQSKSFLNVLLVVPFILGVKSMIQEFKKQEI